MKYAVVAFLLLTGCVTVDPGLDDVNRSVATRANADLQSADDAVAIAVANNPRLQATLAELGIARADLLEVSTIRNPLFEAEIRFPGDPYRPYELRIAQTL
ncbi:MAG TPA: hypothetical protein VN181_07215, partial [Thermoanaerobaculia bacterium]|nr:hypothetical protein [Thermoanaerobaculia bacterium]